MTFVAFQADLSRYRIIFGGCEVWIESDPSPKNFSSIYTTPSSNLLAPNGLLLACLSRRLEIVVQIGKKLLKISKAVINHVI